MTDRDRLAVKICNATQKTNYSCGGANCVGKGTCAYCLVMAEDLIANSVIVPPCKVGETIYYIHETFYDNEYMKAKEDELDFSHIIKVVERPNRKTNLMLEKAQFDWCLMDNWLKGDIFLTKEDAEEKLKELNDNARYIV